MPRNTTILALCVLLLTACGGGQRGRRMAPVQLANYQGTWGGTLTKVSSDCSLATGQQTLVALAFVQNGNQVLVEGGQAKGSVNGRKLVYGTTKVRGANTTRTQANVDMPSDGQSFSGRVTITTTDSSVSPAAVCTENYQLFAQRTNPGANIALSDYLPLHDGDRYEFADGSAISVMRDSSGGAERISVTYARPGGAPATSWMLREGTDPSFLDLLGLSHFDGTHVDQEQFVDSTGLPALTPLPLITLLPRSVVASGLLISEGGRLEGVTGGTSERYGGRSDFYVTYGRVPQAQTAIGMFPDVLVMYVSEVWDKRTVEPGPGRPDGETILSIWFARGFGPVGIQFPGLNAQALESATVGGVREGS